MTRSKNLTECSAISAILEAKAARTKSFRSLHKGTRLGKIYSGNMLASDTGTFVTDLTQSVIQLKAAMRTDENRSVNRVIWKKNNIHAKPMIDPAQN